MNKVYVVQFEAETEVLFAVSEVSEVAILKGLNDDEIEALVMNDYYTDSAEGVWGFTLKLKGVDIDDPNHIKSVIWVTELKIY